ncbi:S41 family peptidase [Salinibacillus xinjiangensis]|uniref:S41 family peptidase n=1 Tax=Salinibacillus xinjiangensis TaxID=1229268 RepID=UPI001E5FA9C5|nr:S41 family peptidase [Salinibacillus xinjiangensis]
MKITDFMHYDTIKNMIQENASLLTSCNNLIIDVRINKGGSDIAYFELLPYLFEGDVIDLKQFQTDTMLTNCTDRNVELRTQFLQKLLSSIDDEATKEQVQSYMRALKENKGKGFVELNLDDDDHQVLTTKSGPEHIILLADVY